MILCGAGASMTRSSDKSLALRLEVGYPNAPSVPSTPGPRRVPGIMAEAGAETEDTWR
ncbi:MAG: hypothetical protein QOE61_5623 [Micromonosporaceae bacterium]|jgi:hypothetical protein|nr:hypothetical protein [Micromonosporaceae bacterium]